MRASLTILFAVLAVLLAALDWRATIGAGYAYRFASFGDLLAARWPEGTAGMVAALRGGWLWDPVGAFVLSLPVAPLLAAVALAVWVTRPGGERRRARARW